MLIDAGISLVGLHRPIQTISELYLPGVIWGDSISPIDGLLFTYGFLELEAIRVSRFYGLPGSTVGAEEPQYRWSRLIDKIPWDSRRDARNYANQIFSLFEGQHLPLVGEHGVKHVKLSGKVRPKGTGLYDDYSGTRAYYGIDLHVSSQAGSPNPYGALPWYYANSYAPPGNSFTPYPYGLYSWGRFDRLLSEYLRDSAEIPSGHRFSDVRRGWDAHTTGVAASTDLRYDRVGTREWLISYTTFHYAYHRCIKTEKTVHVTAVNDGYHHDYAQYPFGGAERIRVTVEHDDLVSFYEAGVLGWEPVLGLQNLASSYTVSKTSTVNYYTWATLFVTSHAYSDDFKPDLRDLLRDLDIKFSAAAPEIRRSAPYSTTEAVADLRSKVNYIESLSELGALGEFYTGPLDIGEGLVKAMKARTFSSVPSFLLFLADSLAGGALLWLFGVEPTINDIAALDNVSDRLAKLATLDWGPQKGQGKHVFTMPVNGSDARITARTTLRLPAVMPGVIQRLLQLENTGLLPTPSNIWDLVPLSFVVDYGFKIGARFMVIEAYFFLLLMGVRNFTHSFTARGDISSEQLDALGYEGDLKYTCYVREVSVHVPDFARDGSVNLDPPRGPKGPLLLALLWVLIRTLLRR